MDYVLVSHLRQESETSRIKVRVCRKWDVYNIQGRFLSTDFVFVDEEGNYIHAIVWGNNSRRLNDKLKEGLVYFIKNFSVVPNKEKYRVVSRNDLMLELNGATTVKRVDQDIEQIPMHAFEFVELDKLEPNVDEHFIDVIGIISTVGNVEEKDVKGSHAKLLNLEIVNITGYRVRITLWGDVALHFKEIWTNQTEDVNIGIFTSMSVKKFANKYYLSSSRCTRLYINAAITEIGELRLNLEHSNNLNDIVGVPGEFTLDFSSKPPINITIADLLKLGKEDRDPDITYSFTAKVIDVQTNNVWYYMSCGEKCKKGLKQTQEGFWCENCNKIVQFPLPRFRLELIVDDGNDKTMVIVFDDGAEFMVKGKAVDLTTKEDEDDDGDEVVLPDPIRNILGNEYCFYTKPSTFFNYEPYGSFVSVKVLSKEQVADTTTTPKLSEKKITEVMINDMTDKKCVRKLDSDNEQLNFDSSTPAQISEKRKKFKHMNDEQSVRRLDLDTESTS